jgi:hypothetical protein
MVLLHADTGFGYRLIWHERTQRDLGLGWVRTQIYRLFPAEDNKTSRMKKAYKY